MHDQRLFRRDPLVIEDLLAIDFDCCRGLQRAQEKPNSITSRKSRRGCPVCDMDQIVSRDTEPGFLMRFAHHRVDSRLILSLRRVRCGCRIVTRVDLAAREYPGTTGKD